MSEPVPPLGTLVRTAPPTADAPDRPARLQGANAGIALTQDTARSAAIAKAEATAVEFEAAMLTTFIEPMLPSDESPVWGGTGSSAWRGLFAQEIAAELARAGGVGLAQTVRPSLTETVQRAANPDLGGPR